MFFRITFQPESFATCHVGYYVARPNGQCACHPRCYAVKDVSLLFAKWGALALLLLTLVMGFLIALAPSLHRNNYTEFPSSFISFPITASRAILHLVPACNISLPSTDAFQQLGLTHLLKRSLLPPLLIFSYSFHTHFAYQLIKCFGK